MLQALAGPIADTSIGWTPSWSYSLAAAEILSHQREPAYEPKRCFDAKQPFRKCLCGWGMEVAA